MLSIRLKLTLWYVAVLMVILSVLSLGIYHSVRNRMESVLMDKVDGGYAMVETVVKNARGDLFDVGHLGHALPFHIKRDNVAVYLTQAWEDASLTDSLDPPVQSWRAPDGRLFRLKRGDIPDYGMELTYAQDATMVEEHLKNLAFILLFALPCALILAVAGGYFLAARALSPVTAITRKAREITADRLSDRLPVSNPHDELGSLATVFNDTLARLEYSFDQLKRFTADASHELRTPLTSIRSVGEVALQGPRDAEARGEAISSMLEETGRLTRLVENLLTLARGESGKVELKPERFDVTALVRETAEDLRILAEEKGQQLHMETPSPLEVRADRETLRQALFNVLHNAIRYTPPGGRIEVSSLSSEEGRALIDIQDTGPGIPGGDRNKVFDRFYRIDEARAASEAGAGLGLAIAKWAVEANGGAITMKDPGHPGTWCRISLPAEK